MSLTRKVIAIRRTIAAFLRFCPGWKRDIAMTYYREDDLPKAAEKGLLPQGTAAQGHVRAKRKCKRLAHKLTPTPLRYADEKCKPPNSSSAA
jgi:hypothetical protein